MDASLEPPCPGRGAESVQHARRREREFRDVGVELLAVLGEHVIAAAHRADRRRQRAAARVAEALAGPQQGLVADDAVAADFLDLVFGVGDDPVPRDQMRAYSAAI